MKRAKKTGAGARWAWVAAATLIAALPALAFVPRADRIANATAKTNERDARAQALQLDLTLRVADREPIGTGQLVTHPTGLARLELRDASQRVERHLLLGTEHTASRNGEELASPRAFLPPLFLLQVDSPTTLRQALSDYGLDLEAAAIAPCGTGLCYVLGDPSRVAPASDPVAPAGSEFEDPVAEIQLEVAPPPPARGRPAPSLWVDARSFEIVRIESVDGVVIELGPLVQFGPVRFPGFITIQEPERDLVRFDIVGVTPVNAPAAVFQRTWLLTPPAPIPGQPADGGSAAPPGAPSGLR